MSRRGGGPSRAGSFRSNVRSVGGAQSVAWQDDATAYEYADSVYPSSSRGGYSDDESYFDDEAEGYYEENDYWDDEEDEGGEGGGGGRRGRAPRYEPPSVKLAERHAEIVNPQHSLDRPFGVVPNDLNEYGVGVVLYFTFLRLLVVAFAGLTLLATPLALAYTMAVPSLDAVARRVPSALHSTALI